jgi:hypothetical protein
VRTSSVTIKAALKGLFSIERRNFTDRDVLSTLHGKENPKNRTDWPNAAFVS